MRVRGDAEQCGAAATALGGAAGAVATVAGQLRQAQLLPTWSGTAQERWAALALRQAVAGEEVSQRLGAAAAALTEHVHALRELQAQAARLVQQAREAGLHLDDDGWIAPPWVEIGPVASPEQELLRQSLWRRQEARAELLARVEALRADEAAAHERLRRSLRTLEQAPALPLPLLTGGSGIPWPLTRWDAPSVALGAASGGAGALPPSALAPGALGAARGPVLVLRSVPLVGVVSTGYGAYVDTEVNGMDGRSAVVKNVVVTAAGTAATGAAVAAAAASLPAAAVVVVGIAAGVVVSVGVGRVWDRIAAAQPGAVPRTQGVQPTPSPGAARPAPTERPTPPRPAPGPRPQPTQGVHNRAGAPSPAAPVQAPSG